MNEGMMRRIALGAVLMLGLVGALAFGLMAGRDSAAPGAPTFGVADAGAPNAAATLTPFTIPAEGGMIPQEVVDALGREDGPKEVPFEIPAPASELGTELPPTVHDAVARVSLGDALALHGSPDVLFLDVRFPHEYELGHIQGAANLPVGDLESRLAQIPKATQIITYCA